MWPTLRQQMLFCWYHWSISFYPELSILVLYSTSLGYLILHFMRSAQWALLLRCCMRNISTNSAGTFDCNLPGRVFLSKLKQTSLKPLSYTQFLHISATGCSAAFLVILPVGLLVQSSPMGKASFRFTVKTHFLGELTTACRRSNKKAS